MWALWRHTKPNSLFFFLETLINTKRKTLVEKHEHKSKHCEICSRCEANVKNILAAKVALHVAGDESRTNVFPIYTPAGAPENGTTSIAFPDILLTSLSFF